MNEGDIAAAREVARECDQKLREDLITMGAPIERWERESDDRIVELLVWR
jgi:hypothetical protein